MIDVGKSSIPNGTLKKIGSFKNCLNTERLIRFVILRFIETYFEVIVQSLERERRSGVFKCPKKFIIIRKK